MRSEIAKKILAFLAVLIAVGALYLRWDEIAPLFSSNVQAAPRPGTPASYTDIGFDLTNLSIPDSEILSGGPGKDGIPALTQPLTVPLDQAEFLEKDDRVVGVTVNGASRAYPIRLLNWHEIINDEIADVPVAVIYCPLCDSVSVVDRRIDNRVLEFGVSGMLHNSNVLLYDRTDNALWSQVGLQAISGPLSGQSLKHLPFTLARFDGWSKSHPQSEIATLETGHRRNYDRNPYERYFGSDELMFPARGANTEPFPNKEPIVGVKNGQATRAYPVSAIAAAPGGRLTDSLGEGQVVLEALDDSANVNIVSVPDGAQVVHTFWFAWKSFHPETTVFKTESP